MPICSDESWSCKTKSSPYQFKHLKSVLLVHGKINKRSYNAVQEIRFDEHIIHNLSFSA